MKKKDKIIFSERTALFMQYINRHGMVNKDSKVKFSDVDFTYLDWYPDAYLYEWFVNNFYAKFDKFYEEALKNKGKYPNAYLMILKKINEIEDKISDDERIILLMRYLNDSGVSIPSGRDKKQIRFCDLDKSVFDKSLIGVWIQKCLASDEDKFISLFSTYKDNYPVAYEKLNFKLLLRNRDVIDGDRVFIIVNYLKDNFLNCHHKFSDIGGNKYDNFLVLRWIRKYIENDGEEFIKLVNNCCNNINVDSNLIFGKLSGDIKKVKTFSLLDKERIEVFINYLETNSFPGIKDKTMFSQIGGNTDDDSIVGRCILRYFTYYPELLWVEIEKYNNKYPIGYEKMVNRLNKYNKISDVRGIPFPIKVEEIIKYLDNEEVTKIPVSLKFSDIDEKFNFNNSVLTWLNNEFEFRLDRFINEIGNYKDKYPLGYSKMADKINSSDSRVTRERLLLIQELKEIRDGFVSDKKIKKFEKK